MNKLRAAGQDWANSLGFNRSREFDVLDVSAESLRESVDDSMLQRDVLSLLPVRASSPRVELPRVDIESYRPEVINAVGLPSVESP